MAEETSGDERLRHLISLADLSRSQVERVLDRARYYFRPVGEPPPSDDILTGQTVANLFFEASTRTRASFELAAKRLNADVLNLDVNMSSRAKGESILDTIYTLQAMQVDIFVVRDASTGVPATIASAVAPHVCVLNAGESEVSHPTQGLLDLLTIQRHKGDVNDLCVTIVGDVAHSRVARSACQALFMFDVGELRLVGPPELLPEKEEFPEARLYTDLKEGIRDADVVMALRLQKERFGTLAEIPDTNEYFRRYGLTSQRLENADPAVIVMHPGPMNRGTEIASELADGPRSVIQEQVSVGLAVRMAVLAIVHEHVLRVRGGPA
jgi:aspartate carbamoyltransferase catalytic subunit